MELVKLPVPVPSIVLLFDVEGGWLVLQQTPRDVTVEPPSADTIPPADADEAVIFVTTETDTIGIVLIVPCFEQLKIKIQSNPTRSTE